MTALRVIENKTIASVERAHLAVAISALDRIEDAARQDLSEDPLKIILQIASDTLAEIRDPATGRPW